jgi:hypothetical protein
MPLSIDHLTNVCSWKPYLKDSVYGYDLQHAVISSDSKTLFLRWSNGTNMVDPPEIIWAVVAVDVATMLAGSLTDTASVKWVWEGQGTSDYFPKSFLSMWVEGDCVVVTYNRAHVALINATTGASLIDVDTATVTPLIYESRKNQDNRVFPHPDGVHFYWLRCTISHLCRDFLVDSFNFKISLCAYLNTITQNNR